MKVSKVINIDKERKRNNLYGTCVKLLESAPPGSYDEVLALVIKMSFDNGYELASMHCAENEEQFLKHYLGLKSLNEAVRGGSNGISKS